MELLANILPWLQIVFAVLMVAGILVQRSEEGLGSAFGGANGGTVYAKRGLEKKIFIGTIILAILFIASSILSLFI